jgi:hypothetical protein
MRDQLPMLTQRFTTSGNECGAKIAREKSATDPAHA